MNIYKVSRNVRNTYSVFRKCIEFVCVAQSEKEAIETHPITGTYIKDGNWWENIQCEDFDYASIIRGPVWIRFKDRNKLKVTLIGTANKNQSKGVICASFINN